MSRSLLFISPITERRMNMKVGKTQSATVLKVAIAIVILTAIAVVVALVSG